ncbi:unnamed protein product, partial [Tetraodon nigroviridis]
VFFMLFMSYIFGLLVNAGILVLIFIDKNLHQPMYLIFCNLLVSDIMWQLKCDPTFDVGPVASSL